MKLMNKLLKEIEEQIKWIEEHGGDEAGYVRRYGSRNDPNHYGDGGEAIFAADNQAYQNLIQRGFRAPAIFGRRRP